MTERSLITSRHPDDLDSRWWKAQGLLRTKLLRLDGEMGSVVNAEKQAVDPAVVSDDVARQLRRLIEQTVFGAGNEAAGQVDRIAGFKPLKPSFTREIGSRR